MSSSRHPTSGSAGDHTRSQRGRAAAAPASVPTAGAGPWNRDGPNGDAKPDVTFRWQFRTEDRRGDTTFLYDNGPVTSLTDPSLLFRQTYDLIELRHGREVKTLVRNGPVAPSNTDPASMPDYGALARQAVSALPGVGGQVFAGQAAMEGEERAAQAGRHRPSSPA